MLNHVAHIVIDLNSDVSNVLNTPCKSYSGLNLFVVRCCACAWNLIACTEFLLSFLPYCFALGCSVRRDNFLLQGRLMNLQEEMPRSQALMNRKWKHCMFLPLIPL